MKVIPILPVRDGKASGPIRGPQWLSQANAISTSCIAMSSSPTRRKGIRTLETSHPPSYYFPSDDIAPFVLQPSRRRTFCEWKGEAIYFDVLVHGETLRDVA